MNKHNTTEKGSKIFMINNLSKKNIWIIILGAYIFLSMFIIALVQAIQINIPLSHSNILLPNGSLNQTNAQTIVFGGFEPYIFWTTISNLFLGIMTILIGLYAFKKIQKIYFVSIIYISVTFLIFWALISWTLNFSKPFEAFSLLNDHLVNPVLGYIALFLIRKQLPAVTNRTIYYSTLGLLAYWLFALILFFGSINVISQSIVNAGGKPEGLGVTVYSFLNFSRPLFISANSSFGLVFFLNLVMFVLIFILPILLGNIVRLIFRIEIIKYKILSLFKNEKLLNDSNLSVRKKIKKSL